MVGSLVWSGVQPDGVTFPCGALAPVLCRAFSQRTTRKIKMSLKILPLTLKQLNEFVALHHRHHKPVQGHRFSIGVASDGEIVGACSVGRPVARSCDPYLVAEVTRLVTNGTYNACSILYSAAARAARAMGFEKIQTYILESEPGTSLKASGWHMEATSPGGQWKHTDGKARRTDQPTEPKQRWVKNLQQNQH